MLNDTFGYDPKTDGIVEIWFNGVKVVDKVGTTLYRYNNRGGQIRLVITPKIGPYWGAPSSLAFGGSAFGGSNQSAFGGNQSQAPTTAAATTHSASVSVVSSIIPLLGLYTPMDQLTADEKEHFTADRFILGKIPMRPPPKELI